MRWKRRGRREEVIDYMDHLQHITQKKWLAYEKQTKGRNTAQVSNIMYASGIGLGGLIYGLERRLGYVTWEGGGIAQGGRRLSTCTDG